jgi:hypothetical protein
MPTLTSALWDGEMQFPALGGLCSHFALRDVAVFGSAVSVVSSCSRDTIGE